MDGRHEAFLLEYSELQSTAVVVNHLRLRQASPDLATRLTGTIRSFLEGLERMDQLHRVTGRGLLLSSVSLAVEYDLALSEAWPATQAIVSHSTLVFTEPHLALPFERMQATLPQFQFELLG